MKCLFIKDGLSIGGTTTSFLNLLSVLPKTGAFRFDVWLGGNTSSRPAGFPAHISVIKNEALERAFARPASLWKKCWQAGREGWLQAALQTKWHPRSVILDNQKICALRALHRPQIDLRQYDVVISWEEFFPCYLLANCIKTKHKIAWIHPDYLQCGFDPHIDREFFAKLDAVAAVSQAGVRSLQKVFADMKGKFWGIKNRLDVLRLRAQAAQRPADMPADGRITLVTVARLQNFSKALDRLVRIAARLQADNLSFNWYIIGEGEDAAALAEMIQKTGTQGCVKLLGARENPYGYMRYADLFVLQSYYEGCPMVVDESLALGTPVVVSRYAAAGEQVLPGCGWIADNEEESIYNLLKQRLLRPAELAAYKKNLRAAGAASYATNEDFLCMLEHIVK